MPARISGNEKYLVVKKSEVQERLGYFHRNPNLCDGIQVVQGLELPDAVVIRRQDLLAAGQFDLYADQIALCRRVLIESGAFEAASQLEVQESYFRDQAALAKVEGKKLPD